MRRNLVIKYLQENGDVALDVARELNSWYGNQEWCDAWDPEEYIDNCVTEAESAKELIRAMYYGGATINDELWRINGYGNLEGVTESELEEEASDYARDIADELEDHWDDIFISDEHLKGLCEEDDKALVKFTNIVYDYDKDNPEDCQAVAELDKEIVMYIPEYDVDDTDTLADYISDETGWCIESYDYEILSKDSELEVD